MAPLAWICYRKCKKKYQSWLLRKSTELAVQMPSIGSGSEAIPFPPESDEPVEDDEQSNARTILSVHTSSQSNGDSSDAEEITPFTAAAAKLEKEEEKQGLLDNVDLQGGESTPASLSFSLMGSGPISIPSTQTGPSQTDSDLSTSNTTQHESGSQQPLPTQSDQNLGRNLPLSGGDGDNDEPLSDVDLCLPSTETLKLPSAELLTPSDFDEDLLGSRHEPEGADSRLVDLPVQQNVPPERHIELETHEVMPFIECEQGLAALKHFEDPESEAVKISDLEFTSPSSGFLAMNQAAPDPIQRQAWGHQAEAGHLQDGAGHNQRQAWGHQTGAGHLQDGAGHNQRQAWGHQTGAGQLQDGTGNNQRQAWSQQPGAGQLQDGAGHNQRQARGQQPGAGHLQDGAGHNQRQAWGQQPGAGQLQDGAGNNQRQAWGHQTGAGQLQDGAGNNQRQAWGHQTGAGQLQDGAGNNQRQAWGHQTGAGQLQDGAGNNQRQAWGHQTEAGQLQDGAGNNQRQTRGQQTGAGQLQDGAIHPKQAPYQQVISEEIDADECVTFSHYQEKRDAFAFFSELDMLLSGDNREEQNWFGVCKWILTPYKPPYKTGTWVDYLKSVRTNNKNPTGSSYFHQVLNEQLIQKDVKLGHVLYFYSEKYPHLKIQQLFQQFHPACQYCQQFYQQL
ncbi:uncharacterized protein [Argopecten irradians]|uniref:uncharacterized protein n=1 Tax=Argopecten irradians TaxID=31199 RepID=UPI00371D468C